MLRIIKMFCLVICIIAPSVMFAIDYKYRKIDDFKTLESFKLVSEFESSYNRYVQECLDNTGGGTGGIPCFVGYKLWDRELNIYYNRLMKALGEKEKELLKESQRAWIIDRDKSMDFNSSLLDDKYKNEDGTMYRLMRAGDADSMMTPVVKQRVLLLKKWLEFLEEHKRDQ